MSAALWIALGVAIAAVLCYVFYMRELIHKSREIDQQVDFSKIRPLTDDDGKD